MPKKHLKNTDFFQQNLLDNRVNPNHKFKIKINTEPRKKYFSAFALKTQMKERKK